MGRLPCFQMADPSGTPGHLRHVAVMDRTAPYNWRKEVMVSLTAVRP
jgi:hypothetical protein